MRHEFCTLFDRNYASRGLVLYQTLARTFSPDFRLTILCIDEQTREAFARMALPKIRLWRVEDLNDADLLEIRKTRPLREFCWTCPAPLMLTMLRELDPGGVATYLDADLGFFGDVEPVFSEMRDNDILIHGHRFSPQYQKYEAASGVFNVGLLAIRHAPQGLACLDRWRLQCLEVCELNPEKGHCGDQKYLNEWPDLYGRLMIAQNPGIGIAPWNVDANTVEEKHGQVVVDGAPLIFYHYHALRVLAGGRWPRWIVQPAHGYEFTEIQRKLIYDPYVTLLRKAHHTLARAGLKASTPTATPVQYLKYIKQMGPLVVG